MDHKILIRTVSHLEGQNNIYESVSHLKGPNNIYGSVLISH
jgi:hypothetical protein